MLSRVSSASNSVWMDNDGGATAVPGDWPASATRDELGLSTFKSMLEDDWYMAGAADAHNLTFPPPPQPAAAAAVIDSSASCSPTSQPFFSSSSKNGLSSLLSSVCSTPFDPGFDDTPPLFNSLFSQMGIPSLTPSNPGLMQQDCTTLLPLGFENSAFMNRNKVIKPLEIFPTVGAQPTLFQKRAMRQGSAGLLGFGLGRRGGEEDEFDDASFDGSGLNYDSDEGLENGTKGEGSEKNGGSTVTGGDQKGKKKGLPAKNLMAERRRRKKLNDRLYMLRSVVPKISKMDRASILGDAIEYLKELLQRINDLHNELESTPSSSSLTATNSNNFHPLTPTPPTLPCRVKEELCHSLIPSPSSQTAKVEVRMREGRAVNIHMFCARKPGLLLSTMRALDSLGLDIQQAVISCFNGFALDVFRAEQGKDGPGVLPEEIKAVLLQSAGFHSM